MFLLLSAGKVSSVFLVSIVSSRLLVIKIAAFSIITICSFEIMTTPTLFFKLDACGVCTL